MCYSYSRRILYVCGAFHYSDSQMVLCAEHKRWVEASTRWQYGGRLAGLPAPESACPGLRHKKRKDETHYLSCAMLCPEHSLQRTKGRCARMFLRLYAVANEWPFSLGDHVPAPRPKHSLPRPSERVTCPHEARGARRTFPTFFISLHRTLMDTLIRGGASGG